VNSRAKYRSARAHAALEAPKFSMSSTDIDWNLPGLESDHTDAALAAFAAVVDPSNSVVIRYCQGGTKVARLALLRHHSKHFKDYSNPLATEMYNRLEDAVTGGPWTEKENNEWWEDRFKKDNIHCGTDEMQHFIHFQTLRGERMLFLGFYPSNAGTKGGALRANVKNSATIRGVLKPATMTGRDWRTADGSYSYLDVCPVRAPGDSEIISSKSLEGIYKFDAEEEGGSGRGKKAIENMIAGTDGMLKAAVEVLVRHDCRPAASATWGVGMANSPIIGIGVGLLEPVARWLEEVTGMPTYKGAHPSVVNGEYFGGHNLATWRPETVEGTDNAMRALWCSAFPLSDVSFKEHMFLTRDFRPATALYAIATVVDYFMEEFERETLEKVRTAARHALLGDVTAESAPAMAAAYVKKLNMVSQMQSVD